MQKLESPSHGDSRCRLLINAWSRSVQIVVLTPTAPWLTAMHNSKVFEIALSHF